MWWYQVYLSLSERGPAVFFGVFFLVWLCSVYKRHHVVVFFPFPRVLCVLHILDENNVCHFKKNLWLNTQMKGFYIWFDTLMIGYTYGLTSFYIWLFDFLEYFHK